MNQDQLAERIGCEAVAWEFIACRFSASASSGKVIIDYLAIRCIFSKYLSRLKKSEKSLLNNTKGKLNTVAKIMMIW